MADMKMIALALFLCASLAASTGALSRDLDMNLKERPVMKVVRLLQDTRAELQHDLDDDKAVHEQLTCWCEENDREKTAAIEAGEAKQSELEAYLGEAVAKMAELKNKRDATLNEVNKDEAAMEEAATLRMKENKEFHAEEANLVEAIKACDQAMVVLKEHSDASPGFAQLRSVAESLQRAQVLELGRRSPGAGALRAFVMRASGATSFLAIPGYQSYAPQSGQIFGVLSQMKEDFEKDLQDAQGKEKKDLVDYTDLKSSKMEEIAAGRKLKTELDEQIADLQEKHAQAFKELEDTKAQLELDRTFLANLREKCSMSADEFDQRVKDRMEEIVAVEDTIKILNEDASFENFDKTVNVALLQTSSTSAQKERLRRATSVLKRAAAQVGAPELALLASRAQLDAFTKVKEEIDKMVVELNKQQQDEIEHRDWCIDELNKNNRSTEEQYDIKENLQAKIADLEKTIDYLTKEITATTKAVADMQEQMKRASENREGENADYQQTVTDQRLTQMILDKAHKRMQQVYAMLQQREEPKPGAPHIHTSGNHTDPGNGPARFTKYEQHAGGSRVLRMLETIMADSRKMEDEAITAEQDSQSAYENFMKDSNKAIAKYTETIVSMKGAKARAEQDLVMAEGDLKATVATLEELHDTNGALHKSCDFIMDTFDARQAARAAEVDALKEAKAILSGAK
mmetsp:Transcript_146731/g.381380  ORF Transcript_146731/g.381380 Transcript_146731/m.381380 type:complete len:688 (+) Transcript_146731:72-2135(+)